MSDIGDTIRKRKRDLKRQGVNCADSYDVGYDTGFAAGIEAALEQAELLPGRIRNLKPEPGHD